MARAGLLHLAAILILAAIAGCSDDELAPATPSDTTRVAFQDGVSPAASYGGTEDAVLKDDPDPAAANVNYGSMPSDTLGAVPLSTAIYERRLIVRMDLTSITDCSEVVSARLVIRIAPLAPASMTLEAHAVNLSTWKRWTEGFGGSAAGVSWITIDGADPWQTQGGDYLSTILDARTVSSDSSVTFALSPALVEEWIRTPSSNHGIIIKTANAAGAAHTVVFQSEAGLAARRPRLEIAYLPGG